MKLISIGEFAEKTGLSTQTLRRWDNNGKLKCYHRLDTGKRYYSEEQLNEYLKIEPTEIQRINVGYVRVSTNKQKDDLQRQESLMETFLAKQGKEFKIISDIGSGINYNKKGLNELIQMIELNQIETIFVLYKDRLVRFGFDLIKNIARFHNTEIQIINSSDKTDQEELTEDVIQILTVYSCRINGKRSHMSKKLAKELKEND